MSTTDPVASPPAETGDPWDQRIAKAYALADEYEKAGRALESWTAVTIRGLASEVERLRALASRPAAPTFDAGRVADWIRDPRRKPATLAFTAGDERQVAYAVEDALRSLASRPAGTAREPGEASPSRGTPRDTLARLISAHFADAPWGELSDAEREKALKCADAVAAALAARPGDDEDECAGEGCLCHEDKTRLGPDAPGEAQANLRAVVRELYYVLGIADWGKLHDSVEALVRSAPRPQAAAGEEAS